MKRQTYIFFALLFLAITAVIILSVKNNSENNLYEPDEQLYNSSLNNSANAPTEIVTDKNGVPLSPDETSSSDETDVGLSPAPSQEPTTTTEPLTDMSYTNTSVGENSSTKQNSNTSNLPTSNSSASIKTTGDEKSISPKRVKDSIVVNSSSPNVTPTVSNTASSAVTASSTISSYSSGTKKYTPAPNNVNTQSEQKQKVTAKATKPTSTKVPGTGNNKKPSVTNSANTQKPVTVYDNTSNSSDSNKSESNNYTEKNYEDSSYNESSNGKSSHDDNESKNHKGKSSHNRENNDYKSNRNHTKKSGRKHNHNR